ncbi:MAG: prolipoprotein diacylglyceryl transferase [Gemmataceae bacterium]
MPPRFFYGLFMLLALGVFVFVRHFVPKPEALRRLPWQKRLALTLCAFIGGVLGAKLPFAVGAADGPLSSLAWLSDGKTITTGLMGAYLMVESGKWWMAIHVKTGDTFALPLACALVVGRWGCFCNGCCFGTPTGLPWGRDFGDGLLRHPTQAYESLFHLGMAVVLWFLLREGWFRGHHLQIYLIAYGVYRFLTEYIRPEPIALVGLTFYQWVSLVLSAAMVGQWWVQRRYEGMNNRANATPTPPDGDHKHLLMEP